MGAARALPQVRVQNNRRLGPGPSPHEVSIDIPKKKRVRRRNKAALPTSLPAIRSMVAGIDVGSREHWVCGPARDDGEPNVRVFGTTTDRLNELADWLADQGPNPRGSSASWIISTGETPRPTSSAPHPHCAQHPLRVRPHPAPGRNPWTSGELPAREGREEHVPCPGPAPHPSGASTPRAGTRRSSSPPRRGGARRHPKDRLPIPGSASAPGWLLRTSSPA